MRGNAQFAAAVVSRPFRDFILPGFIRSGVESFRLCDARARAQVMSLAPKSRYERYGREAKFRSLREASASGDVDVERVG